MFKWDIDVVEYLDSKSFYTIILYRSQWKFN